MRDRRMTRTGLGMAVAVLIAGSAAGQTGDGREGLEAGAETPRRGVVGFGGALPNFDVRFDDAAAVAAVRTALAGERQRRREVAAAELERAIGGARVDFDAALGTPAFVRSTERLLTEAAPGVTARQASRAFVLNRADLFGLAAAQLDSARISREATSSNNGVTSLWRAQRVGGVEVLGAELRANVTADGRIVSVASTMLGEPEGGFQIAERRLSREDAVRIAAGNVGIDLRGPLTARAAEADERGRLAFARTPEVQMDILTREALFPLTAVMLRPVWEVVVAPAASADAYEVLVDANDGRVLRRINRTVYEGMVPATYRVFTGDSPAPFTPGPDSPNGAQGTPVSRESVSLISMDPVASPEGWIPDGSNETLGNNVNAFLDANNDDMPDGPRPMGSPARVFDFPLDLGMVPETYGDAAVTQVFYWSNWFHDRMYGLGFTETFDNFQTDNFGRGGVGGDPIRAEVQDGGDTNNANFLTFQDGSAARMQMYLWPGPSPDRDGAFDTQIVIHELMHGVSIRLLDLIDTLQSRGMGEGWSDFFGLTLLAEATDDPHGVYALSGYATFEGDPGFDDNYYFGVRRYPYSTDLMKNPLTFKDIDDNQFVLNPAIPINPAFGSAVPSQVHNIGQVWCSMLLECRANLWDAQGFAANETMMQLVIDGLKLSPRNPNFIQARDAILLADLVNNDGANQCALWSGFAKRGLGVGATSPGSPSTTDVAEDFSTPFAPVFAYEPAAPDRAAPGVVGIEAAIFERCEAILAGSPTLHVSINGGSFTAIPMSSLGAGRHTADTPPILCGQEVRWYVSAETASGLATDPPSAPTESYPLIPTTAEEVRFEDNFIDDLGWTVSGDAAAGAWQRGFPAGNGDRGDPRRDADGSGWAYLTENGPDNTDVDGGATILTSPTLDGSGGEAVISYFRWWSNDFGANPNQDVMTIEISNDDGMNWTTLEIVSENTNDWVFRSFRVADFLAPTSTMRIRFIAEDADPGSVVEAGVDLVRLEALSCQSSGVFGDLNGDGLVNAADLGALLGSWGACDPEPAPCPADLNNDGDVNAADLGAMLGSWSS